MLPTLKLCWAIHFRLPFVWGYMLNYFQLCLVLSQFLYNKQYQIKITQHFKIKLFLKECPWWGFQNVLKFQFPASSSLPEQKFYLYLIYSATGFSPHPRLEPARLLIDKILA